MASLECGSERHVAKLKIFKDGGSSAMCNHDGCFAEHWFYCLNCGAPVCGQHGVLFKGPMGEDLTSRCDQHQLAERCHEPDCLQTVEDSEKWVDIGHSKMMLVAELERTNDSPWKIIRNHQKRRQSKRQDTYSDFGMYWRVSAIMDKTDCGLKVLRKTAEPFKIVNLNRKKSSQRSRDIAAVF